MSPKSVTAKRNKSKTRQGPKEKNPINQQEVDKSFENYNAMSKTNPIEDQFGDTALASMGEEDSDKLFQHDQIVTNATLLVEALSNEEKMPLADQISKLVDYCRRLKADLVEKNTTNENLLSKIEDADQRIKQTLNISLVSEKSIQKLQSALENAWREVDASRSREQALHDENNEMHKKILELEEKVKKSHKIADTGPVSNKRETISRERDRLQLEVEELEKRLQVQKQYSENVEKLKENAEKTNEALVQEHENDATEKIQLERRIQDLHFISEKSRDTNILLVQKIELIESQIENYQKQIALKAEDLQYVQTQYEKLKTEQASWSRTMMKRNIALNSCIKENKSLKEQLQNALNRLREKESETKEAKKNCKKSVVNLDSLALRQNKMCEIHSQLTEEILTLKHDINNLEKRCAENLRNVEAEKREKEAIIRERNSLNRSILSLTNSKKDLDHSLALKRMTIGKLQDDVIGKGLKLDELKESLDMVVIERDRKAQEIDILNKKVDSLEDSVSKKSDQIVTLKNEVNEMRSLYLKTKQLVGSTTSKQVKLRQHLQGCVEEKDNTKILLTHLNYQVTQLKEEITNHQNTKLTLNLNMNKISKENQKLKIDIQNKTHLLNKMKDELKESKKENENLQKSFSDCQKCLTKEATKLDSVLREKDFVGSQLQERNNDILLLKEKNSIIENSIRRGEMKYKQQIEDIRLLKLEVGRLRSQKNLLTLNLSNTGDIRQEVVKVHRVLLQERLMNSALQEEISTPVNVHRWRRLKGHDPERLDLIRKIIQLQKQILKLQVNLSKREEQVRQSHELYCILKNYIEKLPNCGEVKNKLVESQRLLRSRSRKLKALTAELNARNFETEAHDCESLKDN